MKHKFIHGFLLFLLVALTANRVHVVATHQDDTLCEICLHIQSNDDVDTPTENFSSLEFIDPQQDIGSYQFGFKASTTPRHDAIRGSPTFV